MATVVKCDNPKCSAHYEVSSFLGGHTFTCNRCGSRVTIRDLSYARPGAADGPRLSKGEGARWPLWQVVIFVAVTVIVVLILARS